MDLDADKKACAVESGNDSGVSNLYTSRYVADCLRQRGWIEGQAPSGSEANVDRPSEGESTPAVAALSFDACFERCRALTDRTKEQCFDTCLER